LPVVEQSEKLSPVRRGIRIKRRKCTLRPKPAEEHLVEAFAVDGAEGAIAPIIAAGAGAVVVIDGIHSGGVDEVEGGEGEVVLEDLAWMVVWVPLWMSLMLGTEDFWWSATFCFSCSTVVTAERSISSSKGCSFEGVLKHSLTI
jgi:hypothetical protein